MNFPTTPAPETSPGADPRLKSLAVLMLRSGLGLTLLNSGLLAYIMVRNRPTPGGNSMILATMQIALGLALILGLFTITSAILAGFLLLVQPIVETLSMMSGGVNPNTFGRFAPQFQGFVETGMVSHLLVVAALLWTCESGRNRWSLDHVLFSPRVPRTRKPSSRPGEFIEAAAPGDRTAQFIARHEERPALDPSAER